MSQVASRVRGPRRWSMIVLVILMDIVVLGVLVQACRLWYFGSSVNPERRLFGWYGFMSEPADTKDNKT